MIEGSPTAGFAVVELARWTVWPGLVVSDDALSRCIYQLRRQLSEVGGSSRYKKFVETLPKRGYRLSVAPRTPVSPTAATAASRAATARFSVWVVPAAAAALLAAAIGVWSLNRADYFWRDPLAGAELVRLTDFDGTEQDAAISRDGALVAFLSDRDGTFDVWLHRVDTGAFENLTHGGASDLRNPAVRTVDFTPDGSDVLFWTRFADSSASSVAIRRWAVPSAGGLPRPYLDGVAEVAWSSDGTRMVYHTTASGDPIFVTEPDETVGHQIYVAPPGFHCHFVRWSPDDAFVYFVFGRPPGETDIWRIAATGGEPERITFHDSRVTYPVLLDERTLLYLATAEDGSGPWLYGVDVGRRVPHRIGFGLQPYASLAASADGRRLVATLTTPRTSLWRAPILDRRTQSSDAVRIELPALGGHAPRFASDYLLYLSPINGLDALWEVSGGSARVLWDDRRRRVVAGPAVEPGGHRVALPAVVGDKARLHVFDPADSTARVLAPELDVRGAPAWSPDGRWIAIAASRGSGTQLFKIPVDGDAPVPLVDEYSIDPSWSPDGRFLVYRGTEEGPSFRLKAVTEAGERHEMPNLILPRGADRFALVPAGVLSAGIGLVVLKGELLRKDFWVVDLASGIERQLTDLGEDFVIGDFDVSPDGREIVFDRVRQESDIVLIELARS